MYYYNSERHNECESTTQMPQPHPNLKPNSTWFAYSTCSYDAQQTSVQTKQVGERLVSGTIVINYGWRNCLVWKCTNLLHDHKFIRTLKKVYKIQVV